MEHQILRGAMKRAVVLCALVFTAVSSPALAVDLDPYPPDASEQVIPDKTKDHPAAFLDDLIRQWCLSNGLAFDPLAPRKENQDICYSEI